MSPNITCSELLRFWFR